MDSNFKLLYFGSMTFKDIYSFNFKQKKSEYYI